MPSSCNREPEIIAVLRSGAWPLACDPELRDHLHACPRCAELLEIALGFRQSRAAAIQAASLPEPGVLWWRAQLRRRAAAIERMNRPLAGAHLLACLVAALTIAVLLVTYGLHWLSWLPSLQQSSQAFAAPLRMLSAPAANWTLLLPALATLALLAGLAAWLLVER